VIATAKLKESNQGKKTILFIDEIHRFNKAQQDVLLPDVEEGNPVLIGATVHNPFFSLASPLLSRSLVCELKSLKEDEVLNILSASLKDKIRGLGNLKLKIDKKALAFLAKTCEGDARRALNALEVGALTTPASKDGFIKFDLEVAAESIQKKPILYDKDEDAHYDTASAFIKSMRGSDPDAALYWMAKMLYAGEDPRFIARRICILAAEDVGNADPLALVLANAALQISEFVGMPEARIPLAQAVVYVSCAPKSNASYLAIEKATKDIEGQRVQEVPDHLKDTSYSGAETLGHGKGYKYAHDYEGHYVKQKYTRKKVKYYEPTNIGYEAKIKERLEKLGK
ncbi:MAG: replication-associated recombination protein A, partial [Candidatus Omnitrophica bacterium]|nr:replication-associated recombination protein A [Candidatus Omnitrophota bacterium]